MTTQIALDAVPPLTDEQRDLIRAHYDENPDSGYKSALLAAGVKATRAAAKAAIEGDDDLADVPRRALKIDTGSALKAIGEILSDKEHKDRLRAATFVLAALDGVNEKQAVELTGAGGGPITVAHERRLTLADVVALAEHVDGPRGSAGDELPAAGPLLAELEPGERAASPVPARPEP